MALKCLIVDDEPLALQVLESYISLLPDLALAGKCYNAFEALKFLQFNETDIVFLDIQMPRLMGTAMLRSLTSIPKIVLTTAHKEYAFEAFELNVLDYLLKPISLERFIKCINKIEGTSIARPATQKELSSPSFLYFRIDRKMIKVFLDEILYVESNKDYCKIFLENKPGLLVKYTMNAMEEMVPKDMFIRIHRSFLVSRQKVSSFTQDTVEINNKQIPVGRLYQKQLQKLL